jgi:hypothetical protein
MWPSSFSPIEKSARMKFVLVYINLIVIKISIVCGVTVNLLGFHYGFFPRAPGCMLPSSQIITVLISPSDSRHANLFFFPAVMSYLGNIHIVTFVIAFFPNSFSLQPFKSRRSHHILKISWSEVGFPPLI